MSTVSPTTYSSTTYYPARPNLARWIAVGFLAGAVAALVFHQGTLGLLNMLGMTERAPFSLQPTEPYGVPQLWSLAFWGGVWGVLLAALLRRYDGAALVAAALVTGAVLPTLVAWFLVAPLKGQPLAAGFEATAMAVGLIVNAAWGLGTGLGLALFGRRRPVERRLEGVNRRQVERRRGHRMEPQVIG
jgi:hypothetical protein